MLTDNENLNSTTDNREEKALLWIPLNALTWFQREKTIASILMTYFASFAIWFKSKFTKSQPRGIYILQKSHPPAITTAVFKILKENKPKPEQNIIFQLIFLLWFLSTLHHLPVTVILLSVPVS